jgi:hypothetical protein
MKWRATKNIAIQDFRELTAPSSLRRAVLSTLKPPPAQSEGSEIPAIATQQTLGQRATKAMKSKAERENDGGKTEGKQDENKRRKQSS